jgi:hypothetical protein
MESLYFAMPDPALLVSDQSANAPNCQSQAGPMRAAQTVDVLIAALGSPVAADYAAFVRESSKHQAVLAGDGTIPDQNGLARSPSLVVFADSPLDGPKRRELDDLLEVARHYRVEFIGVVSSFRRHLDDPRVAAVESYVVARAQQAATRVAVFRPGFVLSPHSPMQRLLKKLAAFYPLVPSRLTSCFVESAELFTAIEAERLRGVRDAHWRDLTRCSGNVRAGEPLGRPAGLRNRAYTLLGANRTWREMLVRHQTADALQIFTTAISTVLSWLLVGEAIALALNLLGRRFPGLRSWNVQTLTPRSIGELLCLCNPHNIGHVKVVGYNNGVNHFGHRHPAKTVVSTIHCRRLSHGGEGMLKADCGATVRSALDFLAGNNRDLHVVPNYSYVCLGTAFFVPIHGSAVEFSTIADTIHRVVIYDPANDRIISARRDDRAFREHVYNMTSRVVVLRLYLLTKPKSGYSCRSETLHKPTASDIMTALRDPEATNVEIRQPRAASTKVTVARYYRGQARTSSPAFELPRDSLGKLWDRLEENPVASYLMHAVGRRVVWHTELFMTPSEFEIFWSTHERLPLRKIQLRSLRRDGLPHSACRDDNRISADLFLFRTHKTRFLDYLKTTLPAVRINPGKHSH